MTFTLYPQLPADHDQPVYDAVYAVPTRRYTATLLTFDSRLQRLCREARIRCEQPVARV